MQPNVKIIVTVPESHAGAIRSAMADAGAGTLGNYTHCTFSQKGIGRFMPNKDANPHLGLANTIEEVIEERIETICPTHLIKPVIAAIKQAHPYEEPMIDIYTLYN